MPRLLLALLGSLALAGPALAAPGDPRLVQGTLEWPATLGGAPFIVIQGDDARAYYADVAGARRRTTGPVTAGARIAVVGVEGVRPHEITAMEVGAGDAASLGFTAPRVAPGPIIAPPTTVAAPPAPAPSGEPLWRLHGIVQSIASRGMRVRTADGRTHDVDVSQLSAGTVQRLREGDELSLFGVARSDSRLVANGFIQSESTPSAAPRAPR